MFQSIKKIFLFNKKEMILEVVTTIIASMLGILLMFLVIHFEAKDSRIIYFLSGYEIATFLFVYVLIKMSIFMNKFDLVVSME